MDFEALFAQLKDAGFGEWVKLLEARQRQWLVHHGDFPRWSQALSQLPKIDNARVYFDRAAITVEGDCEDQELLHLALKGLMPWRKGPYQFARESTCTRYWMWQWLPLLAYVRPIPRPGPRYRTLGPV